MSLRILEKDIDLLETLEAYRILTVSQVAHLHGRTRQMARRRLLVLRMAGLVGTMPLAGSSRRGRPEQVLFMTQAGATLLEERRPGGGAGGSDRPMQWSPHFLRHDLLVNWFRIHLARIDEIQSRLKTWFLPPDIVARARIHSVDAPATVGEAGRNRMGGKHLRFVPDGVFALIERKTKKAFLFFLEVDMGTRPVASLSDVGRDAREKILNYQVPSDNYTSPLTTITPPHSRVRLQRSKLRLFRSLEWPTLWEVGEKDAEYESSSQEAHGGVQRAREDRRGGAPGGHGS